MDLQAGTDKLLALALNGAIRDLPARRGIDLEFVVGGNDATNLKKLMGRPSPLQGKFAVSGRVTDPEASSFKVSNLQIVVGENILTGGIDLSLIGQQPQLAAELSAPKINLQPLSVPGIEPLTRVADLGSLKLTLNLSGSNKKFACEKLDLSLGKEELIELHLKGAIDNFSALKGMTLHFIVHAGDVANFRKLGGPDLPFQGPFNISGRFSDSAPKIFKTSTLKAVWGDNDAKGWAGLDLSKERPHLSSELSSQKLDLRPLLARGDEQISTKAQPAKKPGKKDKVFSREPSPLEGLKVIDADIKVRNNEVLLPNLALNDVKIDISLENGNLKVQPFTFTIGGGNADIRFDLRSQQEPASIAGAVKIDQLDIGPMLDQLKYKRSVEGNLDVAIELDGAGDSIAGVMAGVNGHIHIAMRNGRADSRHLALLQRYLGRNVLQLLNPFQVQSESTPINCFVGKIDIKNGQAELKLFLDTDQTSILSAGDVNLQTEALNLGIKPTPKRRQGVSGVGSISFSFRELSQPFRLGGTLAQSSLVVDPARAAFTIGKFAGALDLGPAGLAAFFADLSVGKTDPCVAAFKELERERPSSDESRADEESRKSGDAVHQEKDEESGGFFRRWFRR